jgi:mono/diheme cytochrome c family protein
MFSPSFPLFKAVRSSLLNRQLYTMMNKFLSTALSILGLTLLTTGIFAQAPKPAATPAVAGAPAGAAVDGKAIFLGKCASCHNPSMKAKSTGPALAGVQQRWAGREAILKQWIRNSALVIKSGDAYANALYNEYNKSNMTAFPNLTDGEIDAVLGYIQQKAESPTGGGGGGGNTVATSDTPEVTETSVETKVIYGLGFLVLLTLAVILARMIRNLNGVVVERETGVAPPKTGFREILTSKGFIGFAIFTAIVLGGYLTVSNATSLGRQQGYAPTQPIKFSHKIHAGINKIECQYCHDGARRSKHASIPGASTCMNCHKAINKGPKYGTEEIGKIYASSGYNVEKQVYDKPSKPIEWIRIHNLPDHAYFNHAQHVVAGKVKCQECHGKVEEMEVVYEHAPLSMGWCINCHRNKEVQFKDNKYYEAYQAYHDALKNGTKTKVTVEDIGGLECQKCHY